MPKTHAVVIVGSGIAGLTAAIYTARANLQPVVIEGSEPGGQLTWTSNVENYPGFPDGVGGLDLIDEMRKQAARFGTTFESTDVVDLDLSERPYRIGLQNGQELLSHSVVIASGARARLLGLENESSFLGHGLSTCAVCDGAFFKGQDVVVVGGGDSALEDALFLTRYAKHIRIVHRRDQLRASKIMQDRAKKHPAIDFVWDSEVTEILGTPGRDVSGIRIRNIKTDEVSELACTGLFMAIGHIPNTEMLKGQLPVDKGGYIEAQGVKTKLPGVFAAGDVADPTYQQAVTAAGTGCQAALEAESYLSELELS